MDDATDNFPPLSFYMTWLPASSLPGLPTRAYLPRRVVPTERVKGETGNASSEDLNFSDMNNIYIWVELFKKSADNSIIIVDDDAILCLTRGPKLAVKPREIFIAKEGALSGPPPRKSPCI